jgi:cytochrome P450
MRRLIFRYAARLGRPTLLDFALPLAIPTPYDFGRRRFRQRWMALIEHIIDERRCKPADRPEPDLFDLLTTGQSGCDFSGEQLADQVPTTVVAGHETTAAALFWSLYLMASAPEEQDAVAAEAALVDLGPESAADAVSQLFRTRAVVDEALRLYPPAFVIVRTALADDLVDGILVPTRSLVMISPWVLHRHRRFWEKPETFDPGRFSPGQPPPARFVYMPFGAGPRVCIGAQFALTELVLLLAIVVRTFRIRLAEPRVVRPIGIVGTQPANPPPFLLQLRGEPRTASLCP